MHIYQVIQEKRNLRKGPLFTGETIRSMTLPVSEFYFDFQKFIWGSYDTVASWTFRYSCEYLLISCHGSSLTKATRVDSTMRTASLCHASILLRVEIFIPLWKAIYAKRYGHVMECDVVKCFPHKMALRLTLLMNFFWMSSMVEGWLLLDLVVHIIALISTRLRVFERKWNNKKWE